MTHKLLEKSLVKLTLRSSSNVLGIVDFGTGVTSSYFQSVGYFCSFKDWLIMSFKGSTIYGANSLLSFVGRSKGKVDFVFFKFLSFLNIWISPTWGGGRAGR